MVQTGKIERVIADLKAKGAKVRTRNEKGRTIIQARFPSGKRWDIVKIV